MSAVEQRLSVVTLGGTRLPRARSFYTSLGWVTRAEARDDVVFFQAGELVAPQNVSRRSGGRGRARRLLRSFPGRTPVGVAPNPRWTLDEDGAVTLRPEVRRPHVRRRGAWRPTQTR